MSAERPVKAGEGKRVTGLHTVEPVSWGGFDPSKHGSCFQYIYLMGWFGRSASVVRPVLDDALHALIQNGHELLGCDSRIERLSDRVRDNRRGDVVA